MLALAHHVCSHALAQRLAELGAPQESLFWWVDHRVIYTGGRSSHAHRTGGIAAYTATELGELLPDEVNIPAKTGKPRAYNHWLRFGRYRDGGQRYWCAYPGGTARTNLEERADTEADARAKMLIYLLEQQLLTF